MDIRETLRRAFSSFLAVPTCVIAVFVSLAVGTYALDQAALTWPRPLRSVMEDHVFGDAEATSTLLGTIAGGFITITSITFSLLLLALQQAAGSLSSQVIDQFMRRRLNQLYFGFFVGLTIYALITLATVDPSFNPVFGASLALVFSLVALYILLLLIYSTIKQMQPTEIIRSIHDHTLAARRRQLPLIEETRRSPTLPAANAILVKARQDGFVVGIDVEAIAGEIKRAPSAVEVVFLVSIGSYVAFQDPIAEVRSVSGEDATGIVNVVAHATSLDKERRIATDPAYGIEQIATIAWRSISTSQQNPSPGLAAIHNLRDILARWVAETADESEVKRLPIVYQDDVMARLLNAFESLAVVASESMQHQVSAGIVRTFAVMFNRLPSDQKHRAEDVLMRTLPALGDHVLTAELDEALIALARTLEQAGRLDTATAIRVARTELATTIGHLNSRSTRVRGAQ